MAIWWRNSSILNDKSRTTKVNLRTVEQRNQSKFTRTVQLHDKRSIFRGTTLIHLSGFNFVVCRIRVSLSSLSVSFFI